MTLRLAVRLTADGSDLVGEVRRGPKGLEMVHPEYRVLPGEQAI